MVIQPRFLALAVPFLLLLASGTIMPAAADSSSFHQAALDYLAQMPAHDETSRSDTTVEHPPVDPGSVRAWLPVETGPQYPLVLNREVQHFLDRFTGVHRDVVGVWIGRSNRYLGMIREVLRSRGLPEDLAFTAMIESGFNPVAVSRAGAVGLWQFMAATARRYGLRVDQWVDERRDPEKSTFAAASYLRDLYAQFGSWWLAQAAYNAGENNVTKAMRATGSDDFWVLSRSRFLRRETKEFVPQIQAATMIGRDPSQYGFNQTDTTMTAFETVTVPPGTNLRALARAAGISMEMLTALNPTLVRAVTPPGEPYALKVPIGTGTGALTALASLKAEPPERQRVRAARVVGPKTSVGVVKAAAKRSATARRDVHVVRRNDTVTSIAKAYGVSVNDVLRWNRLEKQTRIRPGDRLKVTDARLPAENDRQASAR